MVGPFFWRRSIFYCFRRLSFTRRNLAVISYNLLLIYGERFYGFFESGCVNETRICDSIKTFLGNCDIDDSFFWERMKYLEENEVIYNKPKNRGNLFYISRREWETVSSLIVVRCAIWCHLCNLKNVKNIHGQVLILVKLQA